MQKKAGKTSFLETLLKMMTDKKRTCSARIYPFMIDGLKRTVKGAPIIVDDLTQAVLINMR
jgi:hypothetical protein